MSKLNDLIKELCPNGVEYKKLGDVCAVVTGDQINKSLLTDNGEYPVYNGGMAPSGYWNDYNAESDTIIISQGGASAGYVNFVPTNFWAGAHCYIVKPSSLIENKYLYYLLKNMQAVIQGSKIGAGIPGLNRQEILKLEVPLPPLKIQQEIVKILDKFTELQAELQAELDLQLERQKTVRDIILDERYTGRQYRRVRLGDIGRFVRGRGLQKKDLYNARVDGSKPCLHYGQIYTYYNTVASGSKSYCSANLADRLAVAHPGDIVVATTSENLDDVGTPIVWLGNEDWYVGGETYIYRHDQNPIFIANQLLTHRFYRYKQMKQSGTKVIRMNDVSLAEYEIVLPSIEYQNKVAKALYDYDLLNTSLISGLPAEINLRQQQYEYYRDKLLSL